MTSCSSRRCTNSFNAETANIPHRGICSTPSTTPPGKKPIILSIGVLCLNYLMYDWCGPEDRQRLHGAGQECGREFYVLDLKIVSYRSAVTTTSTKARVVWQNSPELITVTLTSTQR